jgi:OOP family OmpA-OmpF porin
MRTAPPLVAAALLVSLSAPSARADTRYELDNNALKVPGPVYFETNSDRLKPEGIAALDFVKGYLDAKTSITLLRIEVHSDDQGDAAQNQSLTEKRALAIARQLVGKGVDCKRLLPVGFGATRPVAPNDSPDDRARNRRTAFVNAALRGRPIGGMPVDGGGKIAGDPCR